MPNTLGKNLNSCFSLIKRPQPQLTNSPLHPTSNNNNNNNNHHHQQQHYNSPFTKNYNSLYEDLNNTTNNNPPHPHTTTTTLASCFASAPASPSSASTDYMETEDEMSAGVAPTTPDLTAAYASQRFFISSPGRSNSIVDSLSLSSSSTLLSSTTEEIAGGVPVQTYSPDPYVDFRRSMQEMVDARELGNMKVKQVWKYLQELLLSYLALNPKNTHKYIIGAFTDLVVTLMSPSNDNSSDNNNAHLLPSSFSSSSSSSSFSSSCDDVNNNHIDDGYVI